VLHPLALEGSDLVEAAYQSDGGSYTNDTVANNLETDKGANQSAFRGADIFSHTDSIVHDRRTYRTTLACPLQGTNVFSDGPPHSRTHGATNTCCNDGADTNPVRHCC
jgi:hypothetical protein